MHRDEKKLYRQNTLRRYVRVYIWSCLALVLCCAFIGATLLGNRPFWKSTDDRVDNPTGFEVLALSVLGIYSTVRAIAFLRQGMWVSAHAFYLPTVAQVRTPVATFSDPVNAMRFEDLSTRRYGEFHLDFVAYEFEVGGISQTKTGLRLYFKDSTCVVSSVTGSNDDERAFLHAFVAQVVALRPDLTMSPQLAVYRDTVA